MASRDAGGSRGKKSQRNSLSLHFICLQMFCCYLLWNGCSREPEGKRVQEMKFSCDTGIEECGNTIRENRQMTISEGYVGAMERKPRRCLGSQWPRHTVFFSAVYCSLSAFPSCWGYGWPKSRYQIRLTKSVFEDSCH